MVGILKKIFVVLALFLIITSSVNASPLKITFINPGFEQSNPTGPFWHEVSQFMQAAANDFDILLNIEYANRNHILMKSLISDALLQSPDFLILVDEKGITTEYLLTLNSISSTAIYYLLNSPDDKELTRLNNHGYNILGSLTPDNFQAGSELASSLTSLSNSASINLLALEGDYSTTASLERSNGLHFAVKNDHNVTLIDSSVANWSKQQGYLKALGLLKRHPSINAIWCANDAIAKGAIKALLELDKRSKVKVGAINWSQPDNGIDIEIGGHVTLGALTMVKLYDIHSGKAPLEAAHLKIPIFTKKNKSAMQLLKILKNNTFNKLDFKRFSKSAKEPLPFTISNLVNETEL